MRNKLFIYILVLFLFVIATFYVITTSGLVRLWADDFCSSVLLRNNGYFNSQIIWWKSWTGRYSYIAFLDFFELFGLTGAKILPIIQYTLILLSGLPFSLLSIFFLINSPNIIQTFYWMTGSLNYFAPFILLNLFLFLLIKPFKKTYYILGFILLFIATGFSESFGVASLLLLSFLYLILEKSENRKLLIVGIISTNLSLAIMLLAPGNAVRGASVTHPSGLMDLLTKTFYYSKWYLIHLFYIKTFVISILTIITGAFVFLKPNIKYFKKPKFVIFGSLGFMIAITFAVVGLTYQAMNWEPPERVMSIVNNMIIYAILVFSIGLFQIFNKFVSKKMISIIFCVLVLLLAYQVHLDWSKVKSELKTSAESKTYMTVGKLDGLTENNGWVKSCIIEYYK